MRTLLTTLGLAAFAYGQAPEVGKLFPVQPFPVLGADAGDALHSIADYRGKKILLVQFASW